MSLNLQYIVTKRENKQATTGEIINIGDWQAPAHRRNGSAGRIWCVSLSFCPPSDQPFSSFFLSKNRIQLFVLDTRLGRSEACLEASPARRRSPSSPQRHASGYRFFLTPIEAFLGLKLFHKTVEAFFVDGSSFRGCVVAGPQIPSPSIEALQDAGCSIFFCIVCSSLHAIYSLLSL